MQRIDTLGGEYLALFSNGALMDSAPTFIRKAAAKGAELIYGDALHVKEGGKDEPVFRPAYSPDTLLAYPYTGSLLVLSRRLYSRLQPDGREDADAVYQLLLRAAAMQQKAFHIPHALFRGAPPPPCCSKRIVTDALQRLGRVGAVHEGLFIGSFDVRYGLNGRPLISVVVVNEGDISAVRRTLESIERVNSYRPYELIVADGTIGDARTRAYYDALEQCGAARIVRLPGTENLPRLLNGAAKRAMGELLLFLDAGLTPEHHDAMERLAEQVVQHGIAAAGGKIVDRKNRLLQAGLALGLADLPVSLYAGRRDQIAEPRQNYFTNCTRNVSAVQSAIMVRTERFQALGGFDETFETAAYAAELCLRLSRCRQNTVYTPYARFLDTGTTARRCALSRKNQDRCQDAFRQMRVQGDPMLSQNPLFLASIEKSNFDDLFL